MIKKYAGVLVQLFAVLSLLLCYVQTAAAEKHLVLSDEELDAYATEMGHLEFLTNDGKKMTYADAIREICDITEGLARKENPALSVADCQAMRELITKRICLEQRATDMRVLGDHGIRHIYGNIERSLNILDGMENHYKLATVVGQIYHDISYSDPDVLFILRDDQGKIIYGKEFDHDTRSWDYLKTFDLPFWQSLNILSPADFEAMETAMSFHNTSVGNYARHIGKESLTADEEQAIRAKLQECLDINRLPVAAALQLSDKLALSEREKVALTIEYSPAIMKYLVDGYGIEMMKSVIEPKVYQEASDRYLFLSRVAVVSGKGQPYYDQLGYSIRDMRLAEGKYQIPMNLIQTDSNCVKVKELDGEKYSQVVLKALDYDQGEKLLGTKLASRQFGKFLEDIGIEEKDVPGVIEKAFAGEVKLPESHIMVRFEKQSFPAGDERIAMRQTITQAVKDSPTYALGLAYQDITEACKQGRADDLVVQKMKNLLKEIEGKKKDAKRQSYRESFDKEAGKAIQERDAKQLRKAFDECLKNSCLQDIVSNLWLDDEKNVSAVGAR